MQNRLQPLDAIQDVLAEGKSFWTVFQLRAVPLEPSFRSIAVAVSFERPIPAG